MKLRTDFILASQSPRRRQLLGQLGFTFRVEPSPFEETTPENGHPADIVQALALEKAEPVGLVCGFTQHHALVDDDRVGAEGERRGKPTADGFGLL